MNIFGVTPSTVLQKAILGKYWFVFIPWLAATTASAQTLLVPSERAFNQHYFRPRNIFQKLTWLDQDGKVQNERMLNLVTRVDSVRHQLIFLQLRNDGKRDSSVAELPTLRPLYVSSLGRNQKHIYDYRAGQTVKSSSERDGKFGASEVFTMPNPYFDGFLSEYLLGALPLKPGYTSQFEIYNGDKHKNEVVRIKSVSTDFLSSAVGELQRTNCVVIESDGTESRYWLNADTGEIIKLLFALPNGGFFMKTKA